MPVRRDEDGNIIEEKTERVGSRPEEVVTGPMQSGAESPTDFTRPPANTPQQSGYEARTVVARSKTVEETAPAETVPEDHTRIYRPSARKGSALARPSEQPGGPDEAVPVSDAMDDPPVGWLVVIQGPGQGKVVTLGNGVNPIGRAPDERACLDFGDTLISRQRHALIGAVLI